MSRIIEKNTHLEKQAAKSIDDEIVELVRIRDELKDSIRKLEEAKQKENRKQQLELEINELKQKQERLSKKNAFEKSSEKAEFSKEEVESSKEEEVNAKAYLELERKLEELKQAFADDLFTNFYKKKGDQLSFLSKEDIGPYGCFTFWA